MAGSNQERDAQVQVIRDLFENALVSMLDYFRVVMDGYEKTIADRDKTIDALERRVVMMRERRPRDAVLQSLGGERGDEYPEAEPPVVRWLFPMEKS